MPNNMDDEMVNPFKISRRDERFAGAVLERLPIHGHHGV